MRPVTGFLTDDGQFYEEQDQAERHEANHALHGSYDQYVGQGAKYDRFVNVIINLAPEIRRFLNAVEGPEHRADTIDEVDQATVEREQLAARKSAAAPRQHPSDDGLGGSFEGMEQLTPRGPLYVSDLGNRPQSEEVREGFQIYGPRSR